MGLVELIAALVVESLPSLRTHGGLQSFPLCFAACPLCCIRNVMEVPTKVVNPSAEALLEPEVAKNDDDGGDDDDGKDDGADDG